MASNFQVGTFIMQSKGEPRVYKPDADGIVEMDGEKYRYFDDTFNGARAITLIRVGDAPKDA